MKRKRMRRRSSKRFWKKGVKVRAKNLRAMPMRGGFRL